MVVGVVVFVNNARDITTSVSLEDWQAGQPWWFLSLKIFSRDDIVSLVKNVELHFRQMFVLRGIFFRVEVPFKSSLQPTWLIYRYLVEDRQVQVQVN